MKRVLAFLPLIALAALVAVSAFLLLRGGERESFASGMVDRPAPTYAVTRLGGGDLVTSDAMRGRPYIINIFASWCTPCRAEHPVLMALEERGVAIVGVAYKDEAEDTQRFLDELGDPFAVVGMDPDGRLGLELGVTGAPETFVVDRDGVIRAVHRGPLTPDVVERTILPALEPR
ncbi:MAG: DsbE family thiol:disulfide interchange protein [Hyphomonadaceae bacterium]|nr:DsbE family thiol:disulfide interchange protein [Hyphomonadaceae bacterium]